MQLTNQGRFQFFPLATLSSTLIAVLASTIVAPAIASTPGSWYSITGINAGLNVPGSLETVTTGINKNGDVVGSIGLPQQERLAYVWHDNNQNGKVDPGEIKLLPSNLGGKGSGAEAINDSGKIVGYAMKGGKSQAVVWENGQWVELGTLGGDFGKAIDINNSGVVVGTAKNSSGYNTAFKASPMIAALCSDPNYPATEANSINDSGDWVGSCSRQQGLIEIFLQQIFGSSFRGTVYTDINNPGLIVGNSLLTSGRRGFVDTKQSPGSPVMLSLPVGKSSTDAKALNDKGAIVGSAGTYTRISATNGYYTPDLATLWTDSNAAATNLNDRINQSCGWNLKEATDINNNGQIIGNGTRNGISQGFRLTPYTGFDLRLASGTLKINEGEVANLNFTTSASDDCNPFTESQAITYEVTLPSGQTYNVSGGKTFSLSLPGLTDKQTNTVTVVAKDAQGFISNKWQQDIDVINVIPTIEELTFNNVIITPTSTFAVQVEEVFNLGITATDPGVKDILSSSWSSSNSSRFLSENPPGSWPVSAPNIYHSSGSWKFNAPGIYDLWATVTDDDRGESSSRHITVTVNSAAAVPEPTTIGGLLLAGAIGSQLRRRASRKNKR